MTPDSPSEGTIGISIDGADNVYVLDTNSFRVKKFTQSGELVGEWSAAGQEFEKVERSVGVTLDGAGNVFMLDAALGTIRKYSPTGKLLGSWGFGGPGTEVIGTPGSPPPNAPPGMPPKTSQSPAAKVAAEMTAAEKAVDTAKSAAAGGIPAPGDGLKAPVPPASPVREKKKWWQIWK